jgi:hypothetical protein
MTPTFADIQAAADRIKPYAIRTPLVESWVLNAELGARVFLKLETLQRTGSFKFRGACNRLSMIPQSKRGNGVVAFSSGNHAQGVAAAAQIFGMPAVIVMPADAPRPKIEGTRAFGATVITLMTMPASSPARARWDWRLPMRGRIWGSSWMKSWCLAVVAAWSAAPPWGSKARVVTPGCTAWSRKILPA